ncbi:transmembrane sensor/regulator PpyR [Pseudomonas sp. Irchel s3f7]|uniref:transmembrane sensor/regulator PpyR n=1 Tax=Pseudomonas sp. Irchel s3f7 TaxID=2009153 RepID=UPI000BA31A3C|nr:transmembrane sensor/regulator PpyR [Pseudomonas sp. Irchel s3f7]
MSQLFSNPQNVMQLSSRVLGVGVAMLLAGIYGAYLYAGTLSIPALVSMHAMTILGPTLLKIGYVMRLLSQYRLHAPAGGAIA